MPSFCRHNRLIHNCPICTREQGMEMRPVVSSPISKVDSPRPAGSAGRGGREAARDAPTRAARTNSRARSGRGGGAGGVIVRRLARGADDGYASPLVPGLRSSADAARLAEEIAFATGRLEVLALDPPGLYVEVAEPSADLEERTWLAFLIAYIAPLDGDEPFAAIEAVRTSWASGELPDLAGVDTGPRTAHDPARGTQTLEAYRAWAERAGSQAAAFGGEAAWMAQRRFDRVYERLALPGFGRDARYELLVSLGRLGVYELLGGALHLGGSDEVTVAAKRALGIGDPMLLGRRSADLAQACEVPLEALDLALFNWGCGARAHAGLAPGSEPDEATAARVRDALGL